MKLRKLWLFLAAAVLLALLTVPAFAQTQGSLLLLQVEKDAVIFRIADREGVPAEEFTPALETNLTAQMLSPELAKTLAAFAKEKSVAGQTAGANDEKQISFPNLEQGYYLVCSTAKKGEFAPFLLAIPTTIDGKAVYHVQAQPKTDSPEDPDFTPEPEAPQPMIPQTGNILWPKYLLLGLGGIAIVAGLAEILRGRRKRHE